VTRSTAPATPHTLRAWRGRFPFEGTTVEQFKDAFKNHALTVKEPVNGYISFEIDDGEAYIDVVLDRETFKELMKDLHIKTWVISGQ
jgi:hypothetical protein